MSDSTHFNPSPCHSLSTLAELRQAMQASHVQGSAYLDYLLTGRFFDGKSIWVSEDADTRAAYERLLAIQPHLITESPYDSRFCREGIRVRGENPVLVSSLNSASDSDRAQLAQYQSAVRSGQTRPLAVFAGGPAAKIAALLCARQGTGAPEVRFILDRAQQSNESGSASYEHINHANALSAEFDNSGLAILGTALKRALLGETNPEIALRPEYRRVDLWPRGLALRDIPIYLHYELHGLVQRGLRRIGILNEHDKSRRASQVSSHILTYLEEETGVRLRMDMAGHRTFFLYMSPAQHRLAIKENRHLRQTLGLTIQSLSRSDIERGYGRAALDNICAGDLFPENNCIRHGFDQLVAEGLVQLGATFQSGKRIREILLDPIEEENGPRAVAIRIEDTASHEVVLQPVHNLCLSLGPSATYQFHPELAGSSVNRMLDRHFKLGWPVPYQTIATGVTLQVLFRITDPDRYRALPFTGLKQTHFVEIGSNSQHVLVKLTSGGNIGLPVYSRSYAISAMASLLRIVTPDSGLTFVDVVCAWPCSRGINGPNNGQVVRLADNSAVRFGEGGTGMSKMGSNAQTLLDLSGLPHGLPATVSLDRSEYLHTVLDRRAQVMRRLRRQRRL